MDLVRTDNVATGTKVAKGTFVARPTLVRLKDKIVNSYLAGDHQSGAWIVVDAGMTPGHCKKIFRAAEQFFGNTPPAAIVLTHAHFDHVGALHKILERWNVPVFAHELELPFLTGRADYPPADPTVGGGLMTRMSPLFPRKGLNLGDRVQALPKDGSIPRIEDWRWIASPGHTAGHISLFREADRTLIAGDAFVTVKNESAFAVLLQKEQVSRPPAYLTTDWDESRRSVQRLADLKPEFAATGHGIPMEGNALRDGLQWLAANFEKAMPRDGRYVRQPAVSDANGMQFVPMPVPDPVPKVVAALALGTIVALMLRRKRRASRLRKRAVA